MVKMLNFYELLICIVLFSYVNLFTLDTEGASSGYKNNFRSGVKNFEVPKTFNFADYVERFRKSYNPIETINRAKVFFGRTMRIFQHNILFKKSKVNYYLTQNEFTDWTVEELKSHHLNHDYLAMKPVAESIEHPNEPADKFARESLPLTPRASRCGISELSGDVRVTNDKFNQNHNKVVNFLNDQNLDDFRDFVRKLRYNPVVAREMSALIDAKDISTNDLRLNSTSKIKDAQRKNQIEYQPMVESSNKNYDMGMVKSYGFFGFDEDYWEVNNFAKYLIDEGLNLEPYPVNAAPEKKSPLSALMNSVKDIFEYMAHDEWECCDDDDREYEKIDKPPEEIKKKPSEIVYDIDWRDTGCIVEPKSQLSCNSCYAFATLGLMEYFHCRQTKKLTEFSPQYIIDCGSESSLAGCRGGKIHLVGKFISKYGIELNSLYPYNARENECPYHDQDEMITKAGYLRPQITHWQMFPEMAAWTKWIRKSPLIVGINMPTDFLAYGGGVHDGLDCAPEMVHALLLVGSGSQDGDKFWLMRNSFSNTWGEGGYFRLSKSAPLRCFNAATVVRVDFTKKQSDTIK